MRVAAIERERHVVLVVEAGEVLRVARCLVACCAEIAADETVAIESVEAELVDVDAPGEQGGHRRAGRQHQQRHVHQRLRGVLYPPVAAVVERMTRCST